MLFHFLFVEIKHLVPAEIEDKERCYGADDAAHAHIRQEVLGEIHARVGTQDSQHQQQQHRHVQQDLRPEAVWLICLMIAISQENNQARREHKERRGVA